MKVSTSLSWQWSDCIGCVSFLLWTMNKCCTVPSRTLMDGLQTSRLNS